MRVQRLERPQISIGELGPDDQRGDRENEGVRDLGARQDARDKAMQRGLRGEDDGDSGAQRGCEPSIRHREATEQRRRDEADFGRQARIVIMTLGVGQSCERRHGGCRYSQEWNAAEMSSDCS